MQNTDAKVDETMNVGVKKDEIAGLDNKDNEAYNAQDSEAKNISEVRENEENKFKSETEEYLEREYHLMEMKIGKSKINKEETKENKAKSETDEYMEKESNLMKIKFEESEANKEINKLTRETKEYLENESKLIEKLTKVENIKNIEEKDSLSIENGYFPAKDKKSELYFTEILDTYDGAKILIKPIYYRKYYNVIYKIACKGKLYVLKIFFREEKTGKSTIEEEFNVAQTLGNEHPHFIKGIDIKKKIINSECTRVEMLFDYGGKNLFDLMTTATTQEKKLWILQSLSGYVYMEARRVSHFDIKPQNMVYMNGMLKIIDLGSTIEFPYRADLQNPLGKMNISIKGITKIYCPQEVLSQPDASNWVSDKIDSFCWGMSMYQIIAKKNYEDLAKARNYLNSMTKQEYEEKFLKEVEESKELNELDNNKIIKKAIIASLQYDHNKRCGFADLHKLLLFCEDYAYLTDEQRISALNVIGLSYLDKIGNHEKALYYFEKALNVNIMQKGDEHLDNATFYSNIGLTYGKIGDYKNALEYSGLSLKIRKKILGEEHSEIAQSYNSIGYIYYYMGDYKKSLEFLELSLKIIKKLLGEEHLDTAQGYNNIGLIYDRIGDYKQALAYNELSLKINKKLLGEEHLDTAQCYNNNGLFYYNIGDYKKSLEYLELSLKIKKKIFGEEHSNTAQSYYNIGLIYIHMEDYKKALEYLELSLKITKKILGEEHPDTAQSYNSIGSIYDNMGDYKKALEYNELSLRISKKVLGEEHPDTAASYNNIGLIYINMGDHKRALEYNELSLMISKKIIFMLKNTRRKTFQFFFIFFTIFC